MRKLAMELIAIAVIYGNVAVALQPPPVRNAGLSLPRPGWLLDAFLLPGMFSSYGETNLDFVIAGLRSQDGLRADRGRWLQLRVRDHFPERHGVVFTRLYAAHHWDMHGKVAQQRAWVFLARKIREHHNRLYPNRAVVRIRLGSEEWPISPLGYRAGKREEAIEHHSWFIEEPAP
jgi:hypothetical protein